MPPVGAPLNVRVWTAFVPATVSEPVSTSTPVPALVSDPPAVLTTFAPIIRSSRPAVSLTVIVWADPLRSSVPPIAAGVPPGLSVRAVPPTSVSTPAPGSMFTVPPLSVSVLVRARAFPAPASTAPSMTVVLPNVSVPPSRTVAGAAVAPPATVVVIWATFVFASALMNTIVNGPALAPYTATFPLRAGIRFRCARSWPAVGDAPVVKVSVAARPVTGSSAGTPL